MLEGPTGGMGPQDRLDSLAQGPLMEGPMVGGMEDRHREGLQQVSYCVIVSLVNNISVCVQRQIQSIRDRQTKRHPVERDRQTVQ